MQCLTYFMRWMGSHQVPTYLGRIIYLVRTLNLQLNTGAYCLGDTAPYIPTKAPYQPTQLLLGIKIITLLISVILVTRKNRPTWVCSRLKPHLTNVFGEICCKYGRHKRENFRQRDISCTDILTMDISCCFLLIQNFKIGLTW